MTDTAPNTRFKYPTGYVVMIDNPHLSGAYPGAIHIQQLTPEMLAQVGQYTGWSPNYKHAQETIRRWQKLGLFHGHTIYATPVYTIPGDAFVYEDHVTDSRVVGGVIHQEITNA